MLSGRLVSSLSFILDSFNSCPFSFTLDGAHVCVFLFSSLDRSYLAFLFILDMSHATFLHHYYCMVLMLHLCIIIVMIVFFVLLFCHVIWKILHYHRATEMHVFALLSISGFSLDVCGGKNIKIIFCTLVTNDSVLNPSPLCHKNVVMTNLVASVTIVHWYSQLLSA